MSVEEKENHVDKDALRAELKSWEKAFKDANGGRKPGRADIKNDATIDAKYKLYDRITRRNETASKQTPRKSKRPSESKEEAKADRPRHTIAATPRKSPSKKCQEPMQPPVHSPIQEVQATPAFIKNALGPTPRKDGQVLGIFDMLSATPLKTDKDQGPDADTIIAGTPSKSAAPSSDHHFSRTAQSAGKRFFLDAFTGTPLKRKRGEDDAGTTSSSKRKYATPAFLRRSFPMASIDEESTDTRPAPAPFRKRGLVRSLSTIIQNLKKQEDERMDEEWDIMNDLEREQEEGEEGQKKKEAPPKVLVKDSQAAEMPLGPDQAPVSDDENADERDTGRKPWKKKGLKRQTKRVNMKPVLHKAKKADELEPWDEESETEVVPETQLQDGKPVEARSGWSSDSDEDEKTKGKRKAKKSTAKEGKDAEKSKAKPRKVNPNAHANFRKLKIKNKNSKANGRKFGRR